MDNVKRKRLIVQDTEAPQDKEVVWLDIANYDVPVLKCYKDGSWELIGNNTVGSDSGTLLINPIYYGGRDEKLIIDDTITSILESMDSSTKSIVSKVDCYSKYFYIIVPIDYTLHNVITSTGDNITEFFTPYSDYIYVGNDSISYKIFEFTLNSEIPLDDTLNIEVV